MGIRGISFISIVCALISISAYASLPQTNSGQGKINGSYKDAANMATQEGVSFLKNIFNSTDRPGWLTRTDITYDIQHKYTPITGIETIQPLYENALSTLFWQGRAAYYNSSTTFNLGLGYRHLREDKQFMWGANLFFDENPRFQHKRIGAGGEIFTPYITFRANYYDAYSGKQRVGVNTYERALSGFDASLETPVPYIAWMRFTAQGYHWNGVDESDINGGLLNVRLFPATQVEVDAGLSYDNNLHTQAFLTLNYYLGSPAFIEYSATTAHPRDQFAAQDLEKMRLQKVIRHNAIVVEKTNGVATTPIIVSRGN